LGNIGLFWLFSQSNSLSSSEKEQILNKMKKDPKSFASGDLVFAKVRGYPAWPARVTCPADKNCTKFHVFFYGTYETAICKTEELWIYDAASKAKYGRQKRKFFAEALDEIENRPDIAIAAPGNIFSH
jgi:hypothetical protein